MATGYPCPNPACSHLFPSGSATGATALKCPVCGNVFHLRPSAAAPRPPAPAPKAPPQEASAASATIFAPPTAAGPIVRQIQPKRRRSWAPVIVLTLLVALSAWLLYYFFTYLRNHGDAPAPMGAALDFEKSNFRFRPPAEGWERDDGPRAPLKAVFAIRRPDPISWLAIASKDCKNTTPKDGELLQEADQRLRGYFSNVEWEQKADEQLAGQRAVRLVFTGQRDDTAMVGECYALGSRGFGYWFFTWMPSGDAATQKAAAAEWSELRQGFSLGRERENWQEKSVKHAAVAGKKATYSLRYTEGVWEARTPEEYDADADLALFGRDRSDGPAAGRFATVLVLVLPPQGDLAGAVAAAQKHLQSRQPPKATVTVLEDKTDADRREAHVGGAAGRISKLSVHVPDSSYQRFVLLAVVQTAEQTLAIQCECAWERRIYWEPGFYELLNTFALKK
jgi:hypothetical protein